MSIIEGLKKDLDSAADAKKIPKPEEINKTPPAFLGNDKGRGLFAKYTENLNDPAKMSLVAQYNAQDPNIDLNEFVELSNQFGESLAAAEALAKKMDSKFVAQLARQCPEFGKYVKTFGSEKVAKIWQEKLPELMARDPARFENIKDAIGKYEKRRDDADRKITQKAEKLGIQPDQYASIMKMDNAKDRGEAMLTVVREKYVGFTGGLKRVLGKLGNTEYNAGSIAEMGRKDVEKAILEMNTLLKDLCVPLLELMNDKDSEPGKAFRGELFGNREMFSSSTKEVSFTEAQKSFPKFEAFKADMEEKWASVPAGSIDADDFRDGYIESELKRFGAVSGKNESAIVRARKSLLEFEASGITLP